VSQTSEKVSTPGLPVSPNPGEVFLPQTLATFKARLTSVANLRVSPTPGKINPRRETKSSSIVPTSSFDSKQPKLEPKLVLALSETKQTEIFDVSIEPKQTEDQPKQFDREHILVFFQKIYGFPVFLIFLFLLK
jgi:hypothetical protein